MTAYPKMTAEEWKAEYAEVTREYEELKARGLNLNMARGKPGKAQLDLVSDIFSPLILFVCAKAAGRRIFIFADPGSIK